MPNLPNPKLHPVIPAAWDLADVASVQALWRGDANEEQQRRAFNFIVERLCATYDMSYRPSDTDATTFAEGKRCVGLQLVKCIHLNLATWSKDNAREQHSHPSEHR